MIEKSIAIYAMIEGRAGHRFHGMFRYIGQTRCPSQRFYTHMAAHEKNAHLRHIIALQPGDIEWRILSWHASQLEANIVERKFIAAGRINGNLCNINDGGVDSSAAARMGGIARLFTTTLEQRREDGRRSMAARTPEERQSFLRAGCEAAHTPEARAKMSVTMKQRWANGKYNNTAVMRLGPRHSEESKAKMQLIHRSRLAGYRHSEAAKAKMRIVRSYRRRHC